MARLLAIACALAFSTSVLAQEPQNLHSGVFLSDIWEHKVLMKGPHDFTESQAGANNLWEWADWACSFYGRSAIGPLNQTSPDRNCMYHLGTYNQNPNLFRQAVNDGTIPADFHCSVQYLFACAIGR